MSAGQRKLSLLRWSDRRDCDRERSERPFFIRWGVAVASVVLALLVVRAIPNGGRFPGSVFVAAVIVAAHVGGSGPALLSFVLSGALLDYYFLRPVGSLYVSPEAVPSLVQFLVPSTLGWWLVQRRKYVEMLLARETTLAKTLANVRAEHDKKVHRELERALEFRELVIGLVCHDLRSPLSAASALTQLLLQAKGLPADSSRRLDAIADSLERINSLIGTLLDFNESRFKGALSIATTPTDLAEVCVRVAEEQAIRNQGRGIEVRSDGPMVGHWDPVRVEQVVSNLFANALEHGGAQPASARLCAEEQAVILEVRNAGTPIPPDRMGQLFEPCRRSPTNEPGGRPGLGLGLYIARQIVLAHGGSVVAESTPERGTVFTVRLPRLAQPRHTSPVSQQP
jgi:signal transduction histidine kinase